MIANKSSLVSLLFFIVLILSGYGAFYFYTPPEPVKADSPENIFSAERAYDHLKVIADSPRPVGSEEHRKAGEYIIKSLENMGIETEVQEGTPSVYMWGSLSGSRVKNIIARIPGESCTGAIIFAGHYDTVPHSPGAGDNGAAVAMMIETARALLSGEPLKNDVIFLFSDAEEVGLLGAVEFAFNHPLMKNASLILNFESRGNTGVSAMFQSTPVSGFFIDGFGELEVPKVSSSLMSALSDLLPNDTDLTVFKAAGYPGLNFAMADDLHRYHSRMDNLETLDPGSVQHHGEYALAAALYFGSRDLSTIEKTERVYFDIFGKLFISYTRTLSIVLSIMSVFLFIFTAKLLIKKGTARISGIAKSALAFLIFAAVMVIVTGWLDSLAGTVKSPQIGLIYNKSFFAVHLLVVFAVFTALCHFMIRKYSPAEFVLGVMTPWACLAILTLFIFQGASYLFHWTLFFSIIMLVEYQLYESAEAENKPGFRFLSLITAFAAFTAAAVLLCSTGYQLLILDGGMSPGFPVLFSAMFMVILIFPVLFLQPGIRIFTAAGATDTGIIIFILLMLFAGFSGDNPKANNIRYAFDADTQEAFWITSDSYVDDWLKQFFPDKEKNTGDLPRFFIGKDEYIYNDAPVIIYPGPEVRLVSEHIGEKFRTVTFELSSPRGAQSITIWDENDIRIYNPLVEGKPPVKITRFGYEKDVYLYEKVMGERRSSWNSFITGLGKNDRILVTLSVEKDETINLRVADTSYGLPDELTVNPRPPEFMPGYHSDSDITVVSRKFVF